ncbi:MAG TPA: hypothetical protein VKV95_16455 [Terriglobia bacterium]|nr:hypothetical protein [Terriglobia bacterium]
MTKKMILLAGMVLAMAASVMAAPPDQWIHVRVVSADAKGESVRVNIPMSFAEKILPTICAEKFHEGKVRFDDHFNDVDLRTIFEAIKSTPDNEFVTVKSRDEDVHVAKSGGNLLIKVHERHNYKHGQKVEDGQNVDVKVPLVVVQALLSGKKDELDIMAGIRALSALGNVDLVNVNDGEQTVRVWTDTSSSSE